ncbi:MAG: MaoC family dehydratase [Brooklawnia sp.]|uniref:MaoC family dehydratase n=1 Tax=Brooklawnia sp. TaxID=2699740 RepID=UPI003C7890E6
MRINLAVGDQARFSKTIGESDVYLFAGITGDLSPNHIDEEYGRTTAYGGRIAHGMLVLSLASATSTMIQARAGQACVSYGYDRVRFIAGVLIGDTLTVTYTITAVDHEQAKTFASIEIRNQRDELCAVATHILKFFDAPLG